jgi:hypothetical protein
MAWCCRGVSGAWPNFDGEGVRNAEWLLFDLTGVENIVDVYLFMISSFNVFV